MRESDYPSIILTPSTPEQEKACALLVCGEARDKGDAVLLLQVLGLYPYEAMPQVGRKFAG